MSALDLIGDIHGCADELEALLQKLGYEKKHGRYQHSDRSVVFLGDFIDRGPKQKGTLDLVRPMLDAGTAQAVMGNHEFNAICYATPANDGDYVRAHDKKNTNQHERFLKEYPLGSTAYQEMIAWFKTLPVFLDLGGGLAVHACWCENSIGKLQSNLKDDNTLEESAYLAYGDKSSPQYEALEVLLKGPEYALPPELYFPDNDSNQRKDARIKWWASAEASPSDRLEFGGATFEPAQQSILDDLIIDASFQAPDKPVFFGHYWLDQEPGPLAVNAACLDYSVAKGGKLVAYRWDGEQTLSKENFVWC